MRDVTDIMKFNGIFELCLINSLFNTSEYCKGSNSHLYTYIYIYIYTYIYALDRVYNFTISKADFGISLLYKFT